MFTSPHCPAGSLYSLSAIIRKEPMSYVFPGISKFVDDAAKAAGHDGTDASDPYHILISEAKSNPTLAKVQNALGKMPGLTDSQKAVVLDDVDRISWVKDVEAEAVKMARRHASQGYGIKTESDLKAEADAKAKATDSASKTAEPTKPK